MKLLDKDLNILAQLQTDSKRTLKHLSSSLLLRPSTIHKRIQLLEKEGVIARYAAILDGEKIGCDLVCFVFISGKPKFHLGAETIGDPHVVEAWGVTGEYDVLLKCRFADQKEFSGFLVELRKRYEATINKTETVIATAKIKESTEKPLHV